MKRASDGLLSRDGRMDRKVYMLTFTLPLAFLLALSWWTWAHGQHMLEVMLPALCLGWVGLMAVGDALNVRRWHDLGNSARPYLLLRPGVVLLPLIAFGIEYILPAQAAMVGDHEALIKVIGREFTGTPVSIAPSVVMGVWAVGVIGNVAWLSAMPGQLGPNDYGPDPREGAAGYVPGAVGRTVKPEGDPVERALEEYRCKAIEGLGGPSLAQSTQRTVPGNGQSGGFGKKKR